MLKREEKQLRSILDTMNRLVRFIESDRVALCRVTEVRNGEPLPYEFTCKGTNREFCEYAGKELAPISKGVGSDLMAIYTARTMIEAMLEKNLSPK